ncbi:BMP family ABC transporter substrate-binding protein [Clostridium estertheticum]|uniref:BMP family ABC transporter substrate-binding protein n=1 Tax=Clostridium estertheticum TaxID=238834 RepID=UPI001C6E4684|nr:BMP family ABC transporter substrate-binding protein [Clostridium estertheticum]MBW9151411.1 BMP family ABC transporter substrate-binding protein [Clostridium estertheticum]WLC84616.1 BMP family ABC transporter substrate-binding protein [Clostridium estertheticum]
MKKKLGSLLLAFTLLTSLALVGCGGAKKSDTKATKEKDMTVGFIYVGPVGDGGYTYSHDMGRKGLEKQLGVKTLYKESVKENLADVEQVCEEMINKGATVIIGTSFGFMDGMAASAKKHPDVKYLHASGYTTSTNMSTYFGRIYQARYLSGIVAGMKSKTNKIGYVAAYSIPEVVRGINAFTLGVQSVNPKAIVKVKWTNTWYDPAKEKEAGKALIAEGVDVITQHQDTAGPLQAAEEAGISAIGYNTDMTAKAPKAYMTAPVWNWTPYYVDQIKAIKAGTWKSESYWKGLESGVVALAPLTKNAPKGAAEAVAKAKADILSGKNKVFVGPIIDQSGAVKVAKGIVMTDKELLSFNWFVKGVEGKIAK